MMVLFLIKSIQNPFFVVVKLDLKGWSGPPNETDKLRVGTKVEMTP